MRALVNSFDIFALGFLLVAIGSTGAALSASPPPLEVYGALPKTEDVDLSPDGTKIALVGSENDSRLILVQTIGGEVLLRARIGDLKLKGVQWAGNDDVIVYVHQTDRLFGNQKREDDEGIVYSLKDHNIRPLMRPSGDYLSAIFNVYGVAEINGHPMVYVGLVPTERSRPTANSPGFF